MTAHVRREIDTQRGSLTSNKVPLLRTTGVTSGHRLEPLPILLSTWHIEIPISVSGRKMASTMLKINASPVAVFKFLVTRLV